MDTILSRNFSLSPEWLCHSPSLARPFTESLNFIKAAWAAISNAPAPGMTQPGGQTGN